MSEITPILEKLFQNQPLSGDEKTILRTAFDGSTLQINWWVVEYSIEEVSLETEGDDEVTGYRLNTAYKDASRSYTWTLPGGAKDALAALKMEDMNGHDDWFDLPKEHPVAIEYEVLSEMYPETTLPKGWDEEGYSEGYGDYGTLYAPDGEEWTDGYEPMEEAWCLYHRADNSGGPGLFPPDVWCSQGPHTFTPEQAALLLGVMAEGR